jgi:hypothetical protein
MQQLSDFDRWKCSVSYGHRWMIAETVNVFCDVENVWRMCYGQEFSEHGKGDDVLESVAIQHVRYDEIAITSN